MCPVFTVPIQSVHVGLGYGITIQYVHKKEYQFEAHINNLKNYDSCVTMYGNRNLQE